MPRCKSTPRKRSSSSVTEDARTACIAVQPNPPKRARCTHQPEGSPENTIVIDATTPDDGVVAGVQPHPGVTLCMRLQKLNQFVKKKRKHLPIVLMVQKHDVFRKASLGDDYDHIIEVLSGVIDQLKKK
jgi:hypothetical protein